MPITIPQLRKKFPELKFTEIPEGGPFHAGYQSEFVQSLRDRDVQLARLVHSDPNDWELLARYAERMLVESETDGSPFVALQQYIDRNPLYYKGTHLLYAGLFAEYWMVALGQLLNILDYDGQFEAFVATSDLDTALDNCGPCSFTGRLIDTFPNVPLEYKDQGILLEVDLRGYLELMPQLAAVRPSLRDLGPVRHDECNDLHFVLPPPAKFIRQVALVG